MVAGLLRPSKQGEVHHGLLARFYSVELDEADSHLTTFVTEWGRYKYRTAPQGFLSVFNG